MSKIKLHHLKFSIVSIVTFTLIFILLIFMQHKNVMVITMENTNKSVMNPQIYFTTEGKEYTEDKSRKAFKIKNNKYFFALPDLSQIQYARLDPTMRKMDITITDIKFIHSGWRNTSIFDMPVKNLLPQYQIEAYKKTLKNVHFRTSGNDPQLNMHFNFKRLSTAKNNYFIPLLLSILIYIICFYLYKIYLTSELNTFLTAKLILYSLFFALALFKVDYYKENVRFGYPPDELAHLSYVNHVHTHDNLITKFETMHMLNNTQAGNYLSHPPLYYKILNLAYDENYSIRQNVDNFRTVSMLIFLASFLLLLYLGFASDIGLLAHFVYLSFISSIPMFAYLGGSINNDSLAIFGGLVFIIGLKRLLEQNYTTMTYFILGIGIFIAYFSKLTAAILIFFALLFYFIYLFKTREIPKITKGQIGLLLMFIAPILYYQTYIIMTYHALVPTFNVTFPMQYLHSGFFIPEKYRHYLSHFEWLKRMQHYIEGGWFGIHSHHSFTKDSVWQYIGLLLLHIFALFALFFRCKKENRSFYLIGKIALLSFFSVLIVQYFQSYNVHLHKGYMGGLQPRYLLPFMFAFAIMASIFVERFSKYFLFTLLVIVLCIQALYSDFFYFLKYYI